MLYDTKSQLWIKEIKIWEDSTRTSAESDKIRKNKDRHLKNILVLQKPWSGKKIGASKIDSEACRGSCKWNEKAESSGNTLSSQTQLCLKVIPCKVFVFQFASKHLKGIEFLFPFGIKILFKNPKLLTRKKISIRAL